MSLFRKLSSLFCTAFPCWSCKRGSPCRRELFCPIRQLQKQHDTLFCTSWHPLPCSSAKFSKKLFICFCSKYPLFLHSFFAYCMVLTCRIKSDFCLNPTYFTGVGPVTLTETQEQAEDRNQDEFSLKATARV